ncbi:MAG: DNA-3-methyladenine glycosylase [Bacteroidetes bacterium]|nr:DNA-3-methyladenine glycosylase [Bacteroidota bacterium]
MNHRLKLPLEFYQSEDVVGFARQLLGCVLYTQIDGIVCGGLICETEAYAGITDKASHAYGGRKTARTGAMYESGGLAYVYLCYGMHYLFNVVTGPQDVPHAVLVRGVVPVVGKEEMSRRLGKPLTALRTDGPARLTKALGIDLAMNRQCLIGNCVWIADNSHILSHHEIETTSRIGVEYAGKDANLPYRFLINAESKARLKAYYQ